MTTSSLDPDFAALLGASGKNVPTPKSSDRSGWKYPASQSLDAGPQGQTAPTGSSQAQSWQNPTSGMSGTDKFRAGIGQGLTDVWRHVEDLVDPRGQSLSGLITREGPISRAQEARQLDQPLLNTGAGYAGSLVGQTAATAPVGMGAGAALGRLGALGARLAANPLTMGAVQGAAQGGLMADPGSRLQGMGAGAALGAALPALGKGVSALIRGLPRTPEAQLLLNNDVHLTPGQLNPHGVLNQLEQSAEGVPGLGAMVSNARAAGPKSYTRAQIEGALPSGSKLPLGVTDANDMIAEGSKAFDAAYDTAKGFPVGPKIMRVQGGDVPLSDAIDQIVNKPRLGMTSGSRQATGQELQDLLQQTIGVAKNSGGMTSDHLLALRSTLRDAIRGEAGLTNESRATKGLYKDIEGKITDALESQLPPDAASTLRSTDAQYGKFKTMADAVAKAKDQGNPTPFQISTAIAQNTPKMVYAKGGGAGRDLSKAARDTFQQTSPKTGFAALLSHTLGLVPEIGAGTLAAVPSLSRAATGTTGWQQAGQRGIGGLQQLLQQGRIAQLPGLMGRSGLTSGLLAPQLRTDQQSN